MSIELQVLGAATAAMGSALSVVLKWLSSQSKKRDTATGTFRVPDAILGPAPTTKDGEFTRALSERPPEKHSPGSFALFGQSSLLSD